MKEKITWIGQTSFSYVGKLSDGTVIFADRHRYNRPNGLKGYLWVIRVVQNKKAVAEKTIYSSAVKREAQKLVDGLRQTNPDLEPDLVPILQEVAAKGRVRFHQKHYPLLHAGLVEYASTQRKRFAFVQITEEGMARVSNPESIALDPDSLQDVIAEMCTSATSRERFMRAAHKADLQACEICGKGIKNFETAVPIVYPSTQEIHTYIGPDCAKKIKHFIREHNPGIQKLKRDVSR